MKSLKGLFYFVGDCMKEKKQDYKQDNFLMYVPKQKHDIWEVRKGRVFLIFDHNKAAEKFVRWLVKKPYVSDVELDEMGSRVWQSIDGKKSVYDIGQELLKEFGDKCQPIYERLIMYIRYLNRKGWISFDRGDQEKGGNAEPIGEEK